MTPSKRDLYEARARARVALDLTHPAEDRAREAYGAAQAYLARAGWTREGNRWNLPEPFDDATYEALRSDPSAVPLGCNPDDWTGAVFEIGRDGAGYFTLTFPEA